MKKPAKSVGMTYPEYSEKVLKPTMDKFEADNIWNAAIDAAAKECECWHKGASPKADIAPEIRKLKR